jgi:hypothetical protein
MLGEKFHGCDRLYGIEEAVTWCALQKNDRFLDSVQKTGSKESVRTGKR